MQTNDKSIERNAIDPDDAPKLTQAWAESADAFVGKQMVRRGRPKLDNPKRHVSIRLDPDVVDNFQSQGAGWQARMNEALRKAAGL